MKRSPLRRFTSAVVLVRTVASTAFPTDGLGAITVHGIRVAVPLDMEDVAPPGTGSVSDPTLGSPERGKTMVAHAIESCATVLRRFRGIDPSLPSRPLCGSP